MNDNDNDAGVHHEPTTTIIYERIPCPVYQNLSSRLVIRERDFKCQYAHIYASRLAKERPALEDTARLKWGLDYPVRKLSELLSDEKTIVVGTLFKQMTFKPNVLDEVGEDQIDVLPQPVKDKFVDVSDVLILEDDLQRIVLSGNLDVHKSVTGVLITLLGEEKKDNYGKFIVEDYAYKQIPVQKVPRPIFLEDNYIAFISGLEIGHIPNDGEIFAQLFVDLLSGLLGDDRLQKKMSSISRLVVAGNSLGKNVTDKESSSRSKFHHQSSKKKLLAEQDNNKKLEALQFLDHLFYQLAGSLEVDVMPGDFDPTTYTMPQQPLHPCLFPKASQLNSMKCVTNPYDFSLGESLRIIGTSGQPVEDIYRFTRFDDRLDILEKILIFGHLCPTAPDTLSCYPYSTDDPFCIDHCPNVLFSGNSPSYETRMFEGDRGQRVRLVMVPSFRRTKSFVCLNLRNLECECVQIDESLS